ncbi:TadE/TadG family type IV pilus assembly protein [Thiohalomonas denitrificans]|uniref:Flp pilus assembly protein TadG n=1 Tax=Thiohalomonas denitrificans TaxID=415747 RepID=A0A1G5QE75_9GAMM|nr:TadE/TadG family type IV pilus assembly protein [Thiohalomonas denitrificans]SCZ60195.1 Flp pilus assembly protein TadG [Thiohalomonas denitrificans]
MLIRSQSQRGIALVEFVIVLPLLLILLMVTAEFGSMFYHYNTLTKTVRDGGRYLAEQATPDTTGEIILSDEVATTARNLVVYGEPGVGEPLLEGLATADVSVTQVDTDHVQISAAYQYRPIFEILPVFGFGNDVGPGRTFQASVTMRAL